MMMNVRCSKHVQDKKNWNKIFFVCNKLRDRYYPMYKACSKKDRTFAIKTVFFILQHFKHCSFQSSPLYWRYTVPALLPLLECFLESTFCDGMQFCYCIFLNIVYGLEMTSFQSGFKFGKQEKVCWGYVRRIVGMGHNGCVTFCQITADEERHVSQRIVVVQHPSLVFP